MQSTGVPTLAASLTIVFLMRTALKPRKPSKGERCKDRYIRTAARFQAEEPSACRTCCPDVDSNESRTRIVWIRLF